MGYDKTKGYTLPEPGAIDKIYVSRSRMINGIYIIETSAKIMAKGTSSMGRKEIKR